MESRGIPGKYEELQTITKKRNEIQGYIKYLEQPSSVVKQYTTLRIPPPTSSKYKESRGNTRKYKQIQGNTGRYSKTWSNLHP